MSSAFFDDYELLYKLAYAEVGVLFEEEKNANMVTRFIGGGLKGTGKAVKTVGESLETTGDVLRTPRAMSLADQMPLWQQEAAGRAAAKAAPQGGTVAKAAPQGGTVAKAAPAAAPAQPSAQMTPRARTPEDKTVVTPTRTGNTPAPQAAPGQPLAPPTKPPSGDTPLPVPWEQLSAEQRRAIVTGTGTVGPNGTLIGHAPAPPSAAPTQVPTPAAQATPTAQAAGDAAGQVPMRRPNPFIGAGLLAGGAGGGYLYGQHQAQEEARRNRNLAFGAGLATGTVAPQLIRRAGNLLGSIGGGYGQGGYGQGGY